MTYTGHYIHGNAADYVIVEKDNEFVTALTVDADVLRDFQSPDPSWDNWHGDDGLLSTEPYEDQYGGPIIAERTDTDNIYVWDDERWAERLEFFHR